MGRERETAGEDSLCRKQKNMYGRNGGTKGRESRLRDVLKKEWPVDEKGERIYQITNIYEEKAEELLIVELYTGIHLENGVPCGHFTLYLCGEPDGWKLSETRMMEYLQNL